MAVLPVGAEIRLDEKWAATIRRFYLNLLGSARNPDEPKTVVVRARVTDLQLCDLNPRNLGLQSLNDVVNITEHKPKARLCSLGSDLLSQFRIHLVTKLVELRVAMLNFDINLATNIEQGIRVQKVNPFRARHTIM